jgi:hypothetical protein
MTAKTKLGLAILAVAFLVLNPIGACASMSVASPPAHPCCPKRPAPPADCHTVGCVCINTPPAPSIVPPNTNQGPVLALPASAALDAGYLAADRRPTLERILFAPHDRYLSIHQLLL